MSHTHFDDFAKGRGVAVTNSNGTISVTATTLSSTQLYELIRAAQTVKHDVSLVAGVLTIKPA